VISVKLVAVGSLLELLSQLLLVIRSIKSISNAANARKLFLLKNTFILPVNTSAQSVGLLLVMSVPNAVSPLFKVPRLMHLEKSGMRIISAAQSATAVLRAPSLFVMVARIVLLTPRLHQE